MTRKKKTAKLRATARTWKIICFLLCMLSGLLFVLWVGEAAAHRSGGENPATGAPGGDMPADGAAREATDGAVVVVVDPGHGGKDPGCTGADSGVCEKDINLSISHKVERLLADKGYRVILTRTEDVFYGETKDDDFNERERVIAQAAPDVLVSIHQNEFDDPAECGPQMFYWPGNAAGEALAYCLQDALDSALEVSDKRTPQANDYRILKGNYAGCTVECGFLSNGEEEMLLSDDGYQNTVARAIVDGIIEYTGIK